MKAIDLIFADYAAANDNGKFTLVGAGFNSISAVKVPCVHPLMFILVRLQVARPDVGRNRVEIRLTGEKGSIFKADLNLEVSADHNEEQFVPIAIPVQNLKFETAGDYACEVFINGVLDSSHLLRIRVPEKAPSA